MAAPVDAFQILAVRSSEAVTIRFQVRSNDIDRTRSSWRIGAPTGLPVFNLQICASPSDEPVPSKSPSGENATQWTCALWRSVSVIGAPVSALHTRAVE